MLQLRSWVILLALPAGGCDASIKPAPPDVPATAQTARPPPPATTAEAKDRAEEGSRFQVGDYIVYRYTGSFTKVPVVLRERVLEKNVFRLVIEVMAERGTEKRHWVQVLTDTPDNRKNNVIDELYEVAQGERQRLENVDNKDLLRLFEWTIPPCTGNPEDAGTVEIEMPIAGARYNCKCEKARRTCAGEPAHLETCECENFVWTHASGEARALDDTQVIWKATVEEFGNSRR